MSSQMFRTFKEESSYMDPILAATSKTLDPSLQKQIKTKYQTFTRFNYREAYADSKHKRKRKSETAKIVESDIGAALQLFLKNSLLENQTEKKAKNTTFIEQLPGIKSQRRQRFKKGINTFLIIKHYIQKQNFKPKEQQMYLMKQLAEIKQSSDQSNLDSLLKKIYRIMNEAVDLNQMRFLCLLIMLTADICFYFRQYRRSFFFYNEARIFSSYSQLPQIKIESLMQLGIIAIEIKSYPQAILLLKKALQYAWDNKSQEAELFIYDYMGNAYYYQGNMKQSQYYHKRFTQGQCQHNQSAIKKISSEMLHEYRQHLKPLQTQHLTSLFLQYIQIPIVNHQQIPPPIQYKSKSYQNYDQNGQSPRKKKVSRNYEPQNDTDADKQLYKLLNEDFQFTTEIPNPDVQRNFIITQKFGRPRKQILFEQSAGFHKITHSTEPKIDLKTLQVNTFQKRLEKVLSSRLNDNWWEQMKQKIRKNQVQKIGQMKDRIYNSHQSYYKYPQERRRAHSYKGQKIKESFNKTLLDWIDPLK